MTGCGESSGRETNAATRGGSGGSSPREALRAGFGEAAGGGEQAGLTRARQSLGRLVPNMISSQDGTDDRRDRPPAAFLAGRSRVTDGAASCCS